MLNTNSNSDFLKLQIEALAVQMGTSVKAIKEALELSISNAGSDANAYTDQKVADAIQEILGGADASSDTLAEIAQQIADNLQAEAATNAKLVSVAQAQVFTEAEKQTARENIDAVSVASYDSFFADTATNFNTDRDRLSAIEAELNSASGFNYAQAFLNALNA